ncbi:patatin-like phospholipase family protein [Cohnella sp. GCM10027633]|uniref:patatin-like phospholipase family protein n=1 Tax=unclassified Cohnella TaxID=2636738 RepID=UPI00363D3887
MQRRVSVNAVFEGGGVKGIALSGAVQAAEECGVAFDRVAGTSSGSIVAALIAAGCGAAELKAIIERTPFSSFLKRSSLFNLKLAGPVIRLFLRKGLYSGDALEQWIAGILSSKGIRVFGDLPPGKLQIIASDITNGKLLVLPQDIEAYDLDPRMLPVAKAIRMSASIPYFFDPVVVRQPQRYKARVKARSSYIVDGGLLSNFPLWLFDQKGQAGDAARVLGFQTVGRSETQPHRINGPITMFQAMFETMLSAHDQRYIEQHDRARTIKIPALGVRTTQFNLSPELSRELYDSGLEAGRKFFKQWRPLHEPSDNHGAHGSSNSRVAIGGKRI